MSLGHLGRVFGCLLQYFSSIFHILPSFLAHLIEIGALGLETGQDMVETICGLVTILFESFNAKVLDGRTKAIKATFNPSLFDCYRL